MSVLDIYARYFDRSAGLPRISTEVLAAERVRIVGRDEVPDDARGSLLMLTSGFNPGPEEAHRGTTLGELSQFTVYGRPPPCASFINSAAASVTIGELGDYSDPATGLEHHLAVGCTSDDEKEAMRTAVLTALGKIGNREQDALRQALMEDTRRHTEEIKARLEADIKRKFEEEARNPKPKKKPRAAAKPAAKTKKAKKPSGRKKR